MDGAPLPDSSLAWVSEEQQGLRRRQSGWSSKPSTAFPVTAPVFSNVGWLSARVNGSIAARTAMPGSFSRVGAPGNAGIEISTSQEAFGARMSAAINGRSWDHDLDTRLRRVSSGQCPAGRSVPRGTVQETDRERTFGRCGYRLGLLAPRNQRCCWLTAAG